jgi:hypothetical protein
MAPQFTATNGPCPDGCTTNRFPHQFLAVPDPLNQNGAMLVATFAIRDLTPRMALNRRPICRVRRHRARRTQTLWWQLPQILAWPDRCPRWRINRFGSIFQQV